MLQCSFLFIVKEIIIFMTSCKLVVGNYKGLYNANIWMSTALWGISGNMYIEERTIRTIKINKNTPKTYQFYPSGDNNLIGKNHPSFFYHSSMGGVWL